jgi:hypothetical protein
MGKLKNLSLLQIIISTWATSTKGKEWLWAIQLVREHGGGQKHDFFHLLDLAILNRCVILSFCRSKMQHRKLHGFGSKLIGNESKVASPSFHPRRLNPQTSQMTWHEGWQFECWATAESCMHDQTQIPTKFWCKKCKAWLCLHLFQNLP